MDEPEKGLEVSDSKNTEQVAAYFYMRGYRDQALQQKILETLKQGELQDDDSDTCASGICD